MKKYELQPTEKTTPNGKPFFRVVALRDFGEVLKGDKGGYVESEDNLAHEGDCWVYDDAKVFGNVQVYNDAQVFNNAQVYGNARVSGDAWVFGNARVYGDARISGDSWVSGYARVSGDAWVYGAAWVYDNCPKCGETMTPDERTDGLVSPAQTDTCTHHGIDSGGADYYGTSNPPQEADWNYAYCPNCGEEL